MITVKTLEGDAYVSVAHIVAITPHPDVGIVIHLLSGSKVYAPDLGLQEFITKIEMWGV